MRMQNRDARSLFDAADSPPQLDEHATCDDYLRHAFARNPGIQAAFDRWQASLERIPQARSLDDPTLSFEYLIEQRDTRYQVSLAQQFPAFGKLGLREKRSVSEAEAAMHAFEAERVMVFGRVVQAFHEYHYLERATQVTVENLQLLADLEQVVTIRYKAGTAPFSDVIKAQVEKDRLANDLGSLQDERASRSAVLAALLQLPAHAILPWPQASPSGPTRIDVESLDGMIAELNPELKTATAMIAAEGYREKLARKSFLPDAMLGVNWMVMSGMNGGSKSDVGLMAGITVPLWWGSYRAEIREAGALIRASMHERDNRLNALRAELSLAVFTFRDAERRIDLFTRALIPKATQALEVATQDFSTGKSNFMALVDAQRTVLAFRLMRERALADREIALGEIGCCVGMYDIGAAR